MRLHIHREAMRIFYPIAFSRWSLAIRRAGLRKDQRLIHNAVRRSSVRSESFESNAVCRGLYTFGELHWSCHDSTYSREFNNLIIAAEVLRKSRKDQSGSG